MGTGRKRILSDSRCQVFTYSFLSDIAEPVGAVIVYLLLLPFLTPSLLSSAVAFVAGIMVYISFDEILPMAHRYGREHLVIIGVVIGMGIMAMSLCFLVKMSKTVVNYVLDTGI